LKASLRDIGLEIEFPRSPDTKRTRLVKTCKIPSEPSEHQYQARNQAKTSDDTTDDSTDEIKCILTPSQKYTQNCARIDDLDDLDDLDDTLHNIKGDPKDESAQIM
jgi:hypothetical protein